MKKIYFTISLVLAILIGIRFSNATEYIVHAQGTTIPTDIYVPDTVHAEVGDTITWIWISGLHTTESVNIPAGAAEWSSALDTFTQTFSYVVTVAGTYEYTCHKFAPHGMDGTIIVAEKTATGISSVTNEPVSFAYPNPFSDRVTIETPSADRIIVYGITGQRVKLVDLGRGQTSVDMETEALTAGIYFYSVIKGGVIIGTGKVVKK